MTELLEVRLLLLCKLGYFDYSLDSTYKHFFNKLIYVWVARKKLFQILYVHKYRERGGANIKSITCRSLLIL